MVNIYCSAAQKNSYKYGWLSMHCEYAHMHVLIFMVCLKQRTILTSSNLLQKTSAIVKVIFIDNCFVCKNVFLFINTLLMSMTHS